MAGITGTSKVGGIYLAKFSKSHKNLLGQVDLLCHTGIMKTVQSAEAKSHFSSILKDGEAGNEVAIAYGRKKKIIAVIIPYEK